MQDTASIAHLEDIFIAVAEGEKGAIERLEKELEPILTQPNPAQALVKALSEAVSLICEDQDRVADTPQLLTIVLDLARIGVSSMPMRDAMAAACRKKFSSYPDPAGLLRAMSLLNPDVPIKEVLSRWRRFELLTEGVHVWHSSFGLGTLTDIDGFSDLLTIQFANRQSFSLGTCLSNLCVIKPGALADCLLDSDGGKTPPETCTPEFVTHMTASFIPPVAEAMQMIEAVLVPRYILNRNFNTWRSRGEGLAAKDASGNTRTWKTSRSLEELQVLLKEIKSVTPDEQAIENLSRIYRFSATRDNFQQVLAETLAQLKDMSGDDSEWIDRLLANLPEDTLVFSSPQYFCKITGKLPAKMRLNWLLMAYRSRGEEWFVNNMVSLPYKYWTVTEEIIKPGSESYEQMRVMVRDRVRRGQTNADAALWLWNLGDADSRSAFQNPVSLFRILGQQVMGDFIKARKDLFELLMNDSEFQTNLMQGGTDEGIGNFARSVKTSSLLEKGEQQSLLVKIVRIFPEARAVVEERQEVIGRRPMQKVSSFRSIKERHDELQEIINEKIPANSAAIAHARSYGDLRENAEYKAAKDEQRFLSARRRDLEKLLKEITPTDFSEVVVGETVTPGTTVTLDIDGTAETYFLCGLHDSMPEKFIISYDTPLGRKLMGKRIGDPIIINEERSGRITSIELLPDEVREWMRIPE